ncbi:MAG TPA: hypothetical protein VGM29_08670 [Polyangiaceae bacterium]|jgi:hypothetical protein
MRNLKTSLTPLVVSCDSRFMASAKRDIRSVIDSFSEDLIVIARGAIGAGVELALAKWQVQHRRQLAHDAVEHKREQKQQLEVERLARAAERKRAREELKAQIQALRAERRALSGKKARKSRGLMSDDPIHHPKGDARAPALFVHKRRRDGEIEQLKRKEQEALNGAAAQ